MSELCVIAALVIGLFIGRSWGRQGKPSERKGTRARERPPVIDREAARAVAVRNRQRMNMWNYDGEAQPPIDPSTILEKE